MDSKKIDNFDRLISQYMPDSIMEVLLKLPNEVKINANEIRFRGDRPIIITESDHSRILNDFPKISLKCIDEIFNKICDFSVYSHQAELSQGYITLDGGHRAGICGTASMDKNANRVCHYISSINIRIASEHIGCAEKISSKIFSDGLCSTIIAGPPCSGKTTILRDIARILASKPQMKKVVVVDERSEIAAMCRGKMNNDLGLTCDVLNKYPKGEGIMIALRTLAPDIIICDEIGGKSDAEAVCEGLNAGVKIITSAHACNVNELYSRNQLKIILDTNAFSKVVFLKGGHARCEIDKVWEVAKAKVC